MFKDLNLLFKFRLTFIIVLSAIAGYVISCLYHSIDMGSEIVSLIIGGFLVTAASNALNQVIEIKLDTLMSRTQNRPLVVGSLSRSTAILLSVLMGVLGSVLLAYAFNLFAGLIAFGSLILYSFAYTPLKPFSNFAVFIGAFPGAFPPLIGYVAASGSIDFPAVLLFASQFFWQFPHFWAIAWLAHEDYAKAGFSLLPSHTPDRSSARQIVMYTFFLIPISILPFTIDIVGFVYLVSAILLGIGFLYLTVILYSDLSNNSARKVLFYSFAYLPLLHLAWIIDQL